MSTAYDREQLALSAILKAEGWPKYTNRADDKGGPTKGGITLKTLQRHRPGATIDDLKALTLPQAAAIYLTDYLTPFAAIDDDDLWHACVDYGVTSGPATAIKALQFAARVPADGKFGRITAKAVNEGDPVALRTLVVILRLKHAGRIVSASAKAHRNTAANCQGNNAAGWINRFVRFLPYYEDRL